MSTPTTIEEWLARVDLSRLARPSATTASISMSWRGSVTTICASSASRSATGSACSPPFRLSLPSFRRRRPSSAGSSRSCSATSPIRRRCRRGSIPRTCATSSAPTSGLRRRHRAPRRLRRQVHGRRAARLFRLSARARGRSRARGARRPGDRRPAVGGLQTPAREALQVRIGIATGLVVVGDLIGAGAAEEQSVVGETPNLAARLQALAGPNAILIAEATRRQVGNLFELHRPRPAGAEGLRRRRSRLAGAGRERRRQPLQGAALERHAAGRPRRRRSSC